MSELLKTLGLEVEAGDGSLTELEVQHYLSSNFKTSSNEAFLCALYCVQKRMAGHICISLLDLSNDVEFFKSISIEPKSYDELYEACKDADFIGKPGDFIPFILEGELLYFQKFYKYEQELIEWLIKKSKATHSVSSGTKEYVSGLFSKNPDLINYQEVATLLAIAKDLVILTGSPGTGKTFTIKRIVQALLYENPNANIAFAAPTGKAAQRMNLSLAEFSTEFSLPQATTLHKLLGIRFSVGGSREEAHKLNLDVLVVDEASMLDLSLWVKMIRALPDKCKLVVLGDKNQLASVEAGAILGDLCSESDNSFSKDLMDVIGIPSLEGISQNKLNDCIIELTQSYRFDDLSGISELAEAINRSDTTKVLELLDSASHQYLTREEVKPDDLEEVLEDFGKNHFNRFLESGFSFEVLKERQILCALKRGSYSSDALNEYIENRIKQAIQVSVQQEWFTGKPILITRNNNLYKVYNGEVGYISTGNTSNNPEITFENRSHFSLPVSRLNNLESSFAITVHKSQGSEYDHVAIFLGAKENQVLSKQLLYTAVTRARKSVLIVSSKEIIKSTIEKIALRRSGIREKMLFDSQP